MPQHLGDDVFDDYHTQFVFERGMPSYRYLLISKVAIPRSLVSDGAHLAFRLCSEQQSRVCRPVSIERVSARWVWGYHAFLRSCISGCFFEECSVGIKISNFCNVDNIVLVIDIIPFECKDFAAT